MERVQIENFITFCKAKGTAHYNALEPCCCAYAQFSGEFVGAIERLHPNMGLAIFGPHQDAKEDWRFDLLAERLETMLTTGTGTTRDCA